MAPLAFRLHNLKDVRLQNVLKAAAKAFGWGEAKPESGSGFGLACGFEKNSYVATCEEVMMGKDGAVRVRRVAQAFECGAPAVGNAIFQATNVRLRGLPLAPEAVRV